MNWQPIETAPIDSKQMFVVKALNIQLGAINYTSDPYCVWKENDGSFARWPHKFSPTHWMPLPTEPTE